MIYFVSLFDRHCLSLGDLACRNVLMMEDLNIKVADFGLSRKFGGSGIYVKSSKVSNILIDSLSNYWP